MTLKQSILSIATNRYYTLEKCVGNLIWFDFFFGNLRGWTSKKLIIDNFAHRLDCLIDFLLFHCRNHQEKKRNCSIWITLLENKAKNEWMNVWLLTQKNNTMNIIIIAVVVVVVIRSRYMSSMMFDRWPNQSIE